MEMIYIREYNIKFFKYGDHFLFCICTGAVQERLSYGYGTGVDTRILRYLPNITGASQVADPDPTVPIS
jgi:hypothetical protein